ncbi:hypothetical protein DS66_09210 [Mesotoga sp. SC_3PWM13N19]|nr:hypothetical protein DS66_09210 [Mesotoga sp. SC_3PWM13N19]
MKRAILITFLLLSINLLASFYEITVEATASDETNLIQKLEMRALEEYIIASLPQASPFHREIMTTYYLAYRPQGYVKEIKITEEKREKDYIYAKATALISTGSVITGMNELITDLGNPRIYLQLETAVSVKNVSEPGTIKEMEMQLPLKSVIEPMIMRELTALGFEMVGDPERAQLEMKATATADIYRSATFSLTITLSLELTDRASKIKFHTGQAVEGPMGFQNNPSFLLDYMAEEVVERAFQSAESGIVGYIFNRYDRQIVVKLEEFSEDERNTFIQKMRDTLPAIIGKLTDRGASQTDGKLVHTFEFNYLGTQSALTGTIEKSYKILQIEGNIITVAKRKTELIFTNCSFEGATSVRKSLEGLDYAVKSYRDSVLRVEIYSAIDPFELAMKLAEELGVNVDSFDETEVRMSFKE